MAVKILIVGAFCALTVAIGLVFRKRADSVEGFVLGGNKAGAWLTAFAYGTSYFSAVIFVGYAGQFGWKFGISAVWIGVGNAVLGSLLAWLLLGKRTRSQTRALKSATMPDYFGKRFNSERLRLASAAIIFVFLIPYTASLYNGLSRIFGVAFNVPYEVCVVAMAVLTCVYVVAGGYFATAVNDLIQGIIMIVGIFLIIGAVLGEKGGFSSAVAQLAQVSDAELGAAPGAFASLFGPDPGALLSVIVLTSLGAMGMPQMIHKFYAIDSRRAIRAGTVISTVFALVVAGGCYLLGGFSRLFANEIDLSAGYDAIMPTIVSRLPDALLGIVVVMVMSASMSTLSSLVMTSSSTLTLDLIKPKLAPNMSEKKQLRVIRVLIVAFVAVSVVIALFQYNTQSNFIAQLMGVSWGALAGSFIGPFVFGLYSKRTTRAAVWSSFAFGIGLTLGNMVFGFFSSPVMAGAVAIVGSLVIVPLVSLITPRPTDVPAEIKEFQ